MKLASLKTTAFRIVPRFLTLVAALGAALLPAGAALALTPNARPLGDSRVFAPFPSNPGYPESIAVNGDRVYVSGPAQFGSFVQPKVIAYDLNTGAQVAEYPIKGQNPLAPQAGTGLAFAKNDMLYVGDLQLGVVRFDVDAPGRQEVYASALPDLPTCSTALAGGACSPTALDRTPLINDLVFDKDGNLYISDSFQATIWRVAPGGGAPQVWFQSPALDAEFGPNGMRIDPQGKHLYVAVTFGAGFAGYVYTLPLKAAPAQSDLKLFYQYEPGAGPDGIAFGKSGNLYVALAGTSQVSVLSPGGTESARYGGPAANPGGLLDPLPWANPSAVAFNDKTGSLLVANHAIFVPVPDPFLAVFDVYVNDKADHLARPNVR
ncbi:MAG TPA: SMP-30/gluconolactonase/LRE family protein [Pyrinomonadaceae bacterium]|nr:SMP-30/gluconolactonase/LRE family protein [Pyrinomonadaceae bacterium]